MTASCFAPKQKERESHKTACLCAPCLGAQTLVSTQSKRSFIASHHGPAAASTSRAAARMELRWLPFLAAIRMRLAEHAAQQHPKSSIPPESSATTLSTYSVFPPILSACVSLAQHWQHKHTAHNLLAPVLNLALPRFLCPHSNFPSHCSFACIAPAAQASSSNYRLCGAAS